jgi:uncharacterized membrane protein
MAKVLDKSLDRSMEKTAKPMRRLHYLDWIRGIAALIMLQGHVFHSFLRNDLRTGNAYTFSQFVGGLPPAVFLFLTGVTFGFLMYSQERKGVSPGRRWLTSLRRAGYLFVVAFAFRLQLWIFSWGQSPAGDILRVDILNCMGFALALMSIMSLFTTVDRVRLCAILGLAIACASPLVAQIQWGNTPWLVKSYLAPDALFFGFFPWGAFVAFGLSFGSLLRTIDEEQIPQAMQWIGLTGLVCAFGAYTFSNVGISVYTKSDFWLDNPLLILIKLGILLIAVSFAFLWHRQPSAQTWSWIRQFGVTSLLVYWVHIELVYGRWLGGWKESLTLEQTLFAAVGIIGLMLLFSVIRTNSSKIGGAIAALWQPAPQPERVSGD